MANFDNTPAAGFYQRLARLIKTATAVAGSSGCEAPQLAGHHPGSRSTGHHPGSRSTDRRRPNERTMDQPKPKRSVLSRYDVRRAALRDGMDPAIVDAALAACDPNRDFEVTERAKKKGCTQMICRYKYLLPEGAPRQREGVKAFRYRQDVRSWTDWKARITYWYYNLRPAPAPAPAPVPAPRPRPPPRPRPRRTRARPHRRAGRRHGG